MYDLLIRNAHIVDGTGAKPFDGDVAISDGCIAAIGKSAVEQRAKPSMRTAGLSLPASWTFIRTMTVR